MSPCSPPLTWDIFCTVIDNFGDVGVCWRLAKQLTKDHGQKVRLWIDDLATFGKIHPDSDPQLSEQYCDGVMIRHWCADFPQVAPSDIVIEAFACHLPESFVGAMASRQRQPIWINLDYLSAEAWVSEYHGLPSPHPRLPLTKYFFFPGFNIKTGGLLRESQLLAERDAFRASPAQKDAFWKTLGSPPPRRSLTISLFAYENPALSELLKAWAQSDSKICCLAPVTKTLPTLETFAGRRLQAGDVVQRDQLEIRMLPFVSQAAYDRLLWLSDINFVRGEDSFVRAQWAGRPMLWHIYPQDEGAHLKKLSAFVDLYAATLPELEAQTLRRLSFTWNGQNETGSDLSTLWRDYARSLPTYREHADNWTNILSKQEDLCAQLVHFCQNKL